MGEARRRGTFEERKEQAIREGRIKKEKMNLKKLRRLVGFEPFPVFASILTSGLLNKRR